MSKNVIVIGGPTASGKSRLAIDLAQELNGVVINADATQVYRGIPIISAAPSPEEKQTVEHRLYEYLEPTVNGNVSLWLKDVIAVIHEVWTQNKTPIVVGGSGLYLDNLTKGTTPIPPVAPEVRRQVEDFVQNNGLNALYNQLSACSPRSATMLKPNDQTRVKRAYEIWLTTGKSIDEWYNQPLIQKIPEADFLNLVLLPDKKELDQRCDFRFEQMMEHGAIEEVKYLLELKLDGKLPIMRAKGVSELMEALLQRISFAKAGELAKIHTRQYAKRQLTWFRNRFIPDIICQECYRGDFEFINDVKKRYK